MKFTMSTKPLVDALALGIIPANVSKFYKKSCLAQISVVDPSTFQINLEAASICSEIQLKGAISDGVFESPTTRFVDNVLLKQLLSTIDTATVSFEFVDNGVVIHAGKSKFTLSQLVETDEIELIRPDSTMLSSNSVSIDKSGWNFIKANQMYAISLAFIHPVYTYVWVGQSGDVLVCDYDNGLFTHSVKSNLNQTCLLKDTIINLLTSVPDGSTFYQHDNHYLVHVKTDGYEMLSQFSPKYETDADTGDYHSDMIMMMLEHSNADAIRVNVAALNRVLNQAELLASSSEDTIMFRVDNNQVTLRDSNVNCTISTEGTAPESYEVLFKTTLLKSVINHYQSEDLVSICPIVQDDHTVGIIVWNKDVETAVAGTDNA